MKKFKFRLQVVLGERKRAEDMRQREWNLAQKIMRQMITERDEMETRLATAMDETTAAASQHGTQIGIFQMMESFIDGTKKRIGWKNRDIVRAEKLVERTRVEYVKARQKREALEKLKENQHEEFKDDVRKHEASRLDDIYIMNGGWAKRQAELEEKDEQDK